MSKKLDIISLYLADYSRSLSGREIARNISVSPQAALDSIGELVDQKILDFKIKGRNKEYSLNFDHLSTRIIVELAEHYKALQITENTELQIILGELIPYAETIILFGSFAKGTEKRDSDVDLIMVGKANKAAIKGAVGRYTRKVNIEFVTQKEFEKALKEGKALAIEILKNHILFGDIGQIVNIFMKHYFGIYKR